MTFFQKIRRIIAHFIRFVHLWILFTPTVCLFPLKFFPLTEDLWMDILVWTIEHAGVVWIKAFQYMSHRRDILG